jgi:hypothetical protein
MRKISGGFDDGRYGRIVAISASQLLQRPAAASSKCLVAPANRTPIAKLLQSKTDHSEVHALEPVAHKMAAQKLISGPAVVYHEITLAELTRTGVKFGRIVNPWGLQPRPETIGQFEEDARAVATADGILQTLDWGPTVYPEPIASIPAFAAEIEFSAGAGTPVLTAGWELEDEAEISFTVRYSAEEVKGILAGKVVEQFDAVWSDGAVVDASTTVMYRQYRAA